MTELLNFVPSIGVNDAWGSAYIYKLTDDGYLLASMGADSALGPQPPVEGWHDDPYDPDIRLANGIFEQAPLGALTWLAAQDR